MRQHCSCNSIYDEGHTTTTTTCWLNNESELDECSQINFVFDGLSDSCAC